MKKLNNRKSFAKIVIGLTICLLASCSCEEEIRPMDGDIYLHIPDSNFESKLIELGVDTDGMVNQQILRSDAEQVTRLDLGLATSSGKITDLSGIEAFVNLTYLSAVGQELAEVDLSANVNLDTLFLYANQLTKLDVSHNTNLVLLDAQSNELSIIRGLANLPKLKKVNLSFNNFEELVIDNPSVEVVLASHNQLRCFQTRQAVNLKNLFLALNELITVDVSANSLLETMVLSGNQLQTLDVAQNTKLTHLYISSNLLMRLDVSRNSALVDLRIDRNPELICIKIQENQVIPNVSKSEYQELNVVCD